MATIEDTDQGLPGEVPAGVKTEQEQTEKISAPEAGAPAEAGAVEDVIDVSPPPPPPPPRRAAREPVGDDLDPLEAAGIDGAERYVKASAEINAIVEQITSEIRGPGRRPAIRLRVFRRLPIEDQCWLPEIDVDPRYGVDLDQVGERYGGGIYDLQLKKSGKIVKGAKWTGIAFGGAPLITVGAGLHNPPARAYPAGAGMVAQPAADNAGLESLGRAIGQLAEGVAATQQATIEAVAALRADLEQARSNPPDPLESIQRSVGHIKAILEVAEALRPEPPELPPAPTPHTGVSTIDTVTAIADVVSQRLPGLLALAGGLGSQSDSVPAAATLRPVAQLAGRVSDNRDAPPPAQPVKREQPAGKPRAAKPASKPASKPAKKPASKPPRKAVSKRKR